MTEIQDDAGPRPRPVTTAAPQGALASPPAPAVLPPTAAASSPLLLDDAFAVGLAAVFHVSPTAMCLIRRADSVILDANERWLTGSGYSREEVIGCTSRDLDLWIDPGDSLRLTEALSRASVVSDFEFTSRRKSGAVRMWRASYVLLPVAGEPCLLMSAEDLTERVDPAAQLRLSDAILRSIPILVLAVDSAGNVTYVSPSAETILGFAPADLLGDHWWQAVYGDPADGAARRAHLAAAAGGTVPARSAAYEDTLRGADGRPRWILWQEACGPGDLLVGVGQDITERKGTDVARSELAAIVESSADAIIGKTLDGIITSWNAAAERVYGYSAAEAVGQSLGLLIPPDRGNEMHEILDRVRAGEHIAHFNTVRITKDGRSLNMSLTVSPIQDREGRVVGAATIARDITASRQTVAALEASERELRAVWDAAADAMALIDAQGCIVRVNHACYTLYGYPPEALVGQSFSMFMNPEDRATAQAQYAAVFDGPAESPAYESRVLHADGTSRWVETRSAFITEGDRRLAMLSILRDVTERRRMVDELYHQAHHDPLTGLPNRTLFVDLLTEALAPANGPPQPCALLFLDLDRFKAINDMRGHAFGDQVLLAVAARVAGCLRREDVLARLGDDEFTILLCAPIALEQATGIAERILAALRSPVHLGGSNIAVSASLGIALSSPVPSRSDDLLRDADMALHRAKRTGKARYAVYDTAMDAWVLEQLALEQQLRGALERAEFVLYYQPKVVLASGALEGMEVLVRWRHPQRGLVSPAEFIPLAEEIGLIRPLGRWILREACRQARAWQQACPGPRSLVISVNLSAREFQHADLVRDIACALQDSGLDPRSLQLEITESVLMDDAAAAAITLRGLQALGVQIAVDDFGTGYSSLSYLRRFRVDVLKIDRAFVSGLGADAENRAIVQAVIDMGHALNLVVVAEGVETAEDVAHLRALGCDLGQGYYFARPVPPADAARLLGHTF